MSSLFGDLPKAKNSSHDTEIEHEQSKPSYQSTATASASATEKLSEKSQLSLEKKEAPPVALSFVPLVARKRAKVAPSATMRPRTTVVIPPMAPPKVVHSTKEYTNESNFRDDTRREQTPSPLDPLQQDDPLGFTEEQQQAMRDDPYDPFRPNDILLWHQEQENLQRRERLEEERRVAIEAQEALRERLRQERQSLVDQNDYQRLAEHRQAHMSRGRGVSNLPAWLVERQQQQKAREGQP